eukprot:5298209-Amphidinium_carterae.1
MQCLTKPESFTIPVVKGRRWKALSEPSPVKEKKEGQKPWKALSEPSPVKTKQKAKGRRRLSDASTNAKTH